MFDPPLDCTVCSEHRRLRCTKNRTRSTRGDRTRASGRVTPLHPPIPTTAPIASLARGETIPVFCAQLGRLGRLRLVQHVNVLSRRRSIYGLGTMGNLTNLTATRWGSGLDPLHIHEREVDETPDSALVRSRPLSPASVHPLWRAFTRFVERGAALHVPLFPPAHRNYQPRGLSPVRYREASSKEPVCIRFTVRGPRQRITATTCDDSFSRKFGRAYPNLRPNATKFAL